ncbi:MAG TPA: heparan-alpha-glucosaminide N-acetyltransferase [Candidatus Peribacterales bacterium]|nr:heparan-alpha-glucosaminide N-acetyltransferase [Candidatus Peribacterales bacterium]
MPDDQRYSELDALRGLAVISMIVFHLCFDLAFFYGMDIPVHSKLFTLWARGTAMMFLIVMGVCFVISWSRRAAFPQHDTVFHRYIPFLRRGLLILGGGMMISFVTYLIAPGAYVKFGILHLIGVSALIQPLFVRFKFWNVLIGAAWSIAGLKIVALQSSSTLLFPFGILYPGFFSLDYYPLFPWFGFVLTGMGIGSMLYAPREKFLERLDALPYPHMLLWMGKQALPLYFFHQPILFVILLMLLGSPLSPNL